MSNPTPPDDTPETAEPTPIFDTVAADNDPAATQDDLASAQNAPEAAVQAPPAAAADHVSAAASAERTTQEPPALIEPPRATTAQGGVGVTTTPDAVPAAASVPPQVMDAPPMPLSGTDVPEASAAPAAPARPAAPLDQAASLDQTAPPAGFTPPAPHTVYVTAPTPPKRKNNRLAGVLYALLATVVFCILFIGVAAIVLYQQYPADIARFLPEFLRTLAFLVPSILFLVGFVILTLLANRAGWWAYVLGSFLVAAFVYFGTIGVVLLSRDVIAMTPREAAEAFSIVAVNQWVIIATIIAREVSIWFGAPIARRGRRLTEQNAEALAAFERERASTVGEPYPAQP